MLLSSKMSFPLFDSYHLCKAHSNTNTDIYQEDFSIFMSLFSFFIKNHRLKRAKCIFLLHIFKWSVFV